MTMRRLMLWLAAVLLAASGLAAQNEIQIAAGSAADQAITAIGKEPDAQKRAALLQEFVQKFGADRDAVAYGNWQLAQLAQASGELDKALDYGDKALAAVPGVLDILMLQADVAQQKKDFARVVEYACRGSVAYDAIGSGEKPAGTSQEQFAALAAQAKERLRPNYQYLEAAAYNAIVAEPDAGKRLAEIERFNTSFAGSQYVGPAVTLAVVTLSQMNDPGRLAAFGDKAVASHPGDAQLLTVLATALANDPGGSQLGKAAEYAQKAIAMSKNASDSKAQPVAGAAHSALGYVLLRQEKLAPAVEELKTASELLKGNAGEQGAALFRLGYAYAKLNQASNAMGTLTQAAALDSPYQKQAQEMLEKIKAARAKKTGQ